MVPGEGPAQACRQLTKTPDQKAPGILATHVTYGMLTPWPAGALALTSLLLVLVLAGRGRSRPLLLTAALLTVVSALAGSAIIVVGHAGTTAVWGT